MKNTRINRKKKKHTKRKKSLSHKARGIIYHDENLWDYQNVAMHRDKIKTAEELSSNEERRKNGKDYFEKDYCNFLQFCYLQ